MTVVGKYVKRVRESLHENGSNAIEIDVYDVLAVFGVTCPAIQHAVKKLLCPGQRGAKDAMQDLCEAKFSVNRAIQLLKAQQAGTKQEQQQ